MIESEVLKKTADRLVCTTFFFPFPLAVVQMWGPPTNIRFSFVMAYLNLRKDYCSYGYSTTVQSVIKHDAQVHTVQTTS